MGSKIMCGRYALFNNEAVEDRYDIELPDDFKPNYNVVPTDGMPVITEEGLQMMRWGIIPQWAKDEKIGYKLFNTRSESVFEKPMWKGLITKKKCLVPANGFYEWKKLEKAKQKYYIHLENQDVFSFAGIWESWKHDGKEWQTYSILTTEPNELMKSIHDRMPVILHKADEAQWIEADSREDLEPLLVSFPEKLMDAYEVRNDAELVKTNNEKLIAPINSK